MIKLQVQKKDGSLEEFDKGKIAAALSRVGLAPEEAQKVADQVELWAGTAAQNGVVVSAAIRDQVLSLITPEMAEEYKKFEAQKGGETPPAVPPAQPAEQPQVPTTPQP